MKKKILIYLLVLTIGIWLTQAVGESLIIRFVEAANALLDGSIHSDTTAGTVARGDILTGEGASPTWTRKALGTSGQLLQSDGTDIAWVGFTGTSSITTLGTIATGTWQATDVGVAYGGTGASTLTDGGILLGSGTSAITALGVLADGSIVVGDGATDPVALAAFTNSTGDLIHEAGGLEADVSGYTDGLYGQASGATEDIDTEGELETALGGLDVVTVTTDDISSANLADLVSDETGTGVVVFGTSPTFTTGITVPNDSISAAELNEGDNFAWTAVQDFTGASSILGVLTSESDTFSSVVGRENIANGNIAASDVTVDNLLATSGTASAAIVHATTRIDLPGTAGTYFINSGGASVPPFTHDLLANSNRRLTGYEDIDFVISQPDSINTEEPMMPIFHADADKYPNGVELVNVQITVSETTSYEMGFYEYSSAPAQQNVIASPTIVAARYDEVKALADSSLDADDYVYIRIPDTDISWCHGKVIFYAK